MVVGLLTYVSLVACGCLVFYFFFPEFSCMSKLVPSVRQVSKVQHPPNIRQRMLAGDATHVTKLTEGSKLTHATKSNKDAIKTLS